MLGSKPIPENFVSGSREALGLLKESLGIASARDGTSTGGLTYDLTKHISGVNFEKAVNHLRPTGGRDKREIPYCGGGNSSAGDTSMRETPKA